MMTTAVLPRFLIALFALLLACSGTHSRKSGDSGAPSPADDAGTAARGGPAGAAGGTESMGGRSAAGQGAAGTSSPDFADVGVGTWVGEIMAYGSQLCDPEFAARPIQFGSDDTDDPHAPDDRVALVIDASGGELAGRIAFGEGEPPANPYPHPNGSNMVWDCPSYLPAEGASYAVESIVQRDSRLTFEIRPHRIWDAWCQRERFRCTVERCGPGPWFEICDCDGDSCRATETRPVLIDLFATADSMEGVLHAETVLAKLAIRLFRVK